MNENTELGQSTLAPNLFCYLIVADWAPASVFCKEIFEKVKNDNPFENLTFILKDYDKDYSSSQIEQYKIKGVPLWRICSGSVIKYDHYGQLPSVKDLYELIERYLHEI